jgi:protein SCO1/2
MTTPHHPAIAPPDSGVLGRRLLWGALVLVLAGVLFAFVGTRYLWPDLVPRSARSVELPSYGPVADFSLTDQLGRTVTRADFDGAAWVADFIFTRCSGPCPLMTFQMARLADSLEAAPVRFASFSVDPERDTPEVLKGYADNYGADHERWRFLTGERRIISDIAHRSFHLAVDEPRPVTGAEAESASDCSPPPAAHDPNAAWDIPHSIRFALVDSKGEIRGYYDGTDESAIARLHRDLELLLGPSS